MKTPWWKSSYYPPSVWTPADRAEALKQGWRPPRQPHLPALDERALVAPTAQLVPGGFGLYASPKQSDADRSRRADAVLRAAGIRRP